MGTSPGSCFGRERSPLFNSKSVLFIDYHQAKVSKRHLVFEKRVRADDDARLSAGDLKQRLTAHRRRLRPGEQGDGRRVLRTAQQALLSQRSKEGADRARMLSGQHFGGR